MIAPLFRILALALMLALLSASRVLAVGGSGPAPGESLGGPSAPLSFSSTPCPHRG
jgi:hypothetical protein